MGYTNLTQTPKNVVNSLDHLGLLVGLPRLPEETNKDYRERLWDVFVARAGSHFQGLMNGITRELGLSTYDAITITASGSAGTYPRLVVNDTTIDIYSNWESDLTYTLYTSIDIFTRTSASYKMVDLVDSISDTGIYSASLVADIPNQYAPSALLLPADTLTTVFDHALRPIYRNLLPDANLIGPVHFSSQGAGVFEVEQATEALVVTDGDYYIDRANGVIASFDIVPTGTTCSYQYDASPLTLKASEVKLYEFNSETFKKAIFEQVGGEDGLPTSEAVEFINELLAVSSQLWGP